MYPDLKGTLVDSMDNNNGHFNVATVHAYINKCIRIIIEHNSLFSEQTEIDNSSNSSDDENNGSEKDIPVRQSNEYNLIL